MALQDTLLTVNALFAEYSSLLPMKREDEDRLWKKLRLEWNYNSNHIEGNTLTYGETQLLLIFGKTSGDHELREYEEMKAHDVAIKAVREWALERDRILTQRDIRELNEIILVRPFWKEALTYDGQPTRRLIEIGQYKEHPNSVRLPDGEMFHYTSPEETPIKMQELVDDFNESVDQLPTVVAAADLHYDFICIHPFDDGNGRVARLLVNYVLMQAGYPPIVIKSADKSKYLTALQKADSGDREAFHEFIAEQLVWSLELGIKAAKGESLEELGDLEKEIDIWKKGLGNKEEVKIRSSLAIKEIFYNGLKYLLTSYIERMISSFGELFTSVDISARLDNSSQSNEPIKFIEDLINARAHHAIAQDFDLHRDIPIENFLQHPISKIDLYIFLDGFNKDVTNTFPHQSFILIYFNQFTYKIQFIEKHCEFHYSQFITIEKSDEIINEIVKHSYEQIKSRIISQS